MYTKVLSFHIVARIWDLMFVETGPIALYRAALGA